MNFNNMSEKEQIDLVSQNGYRIQYINKPSETVQMAAVKQNGNAISFIDEPCKDAIVISVLWLVSKDHMISAKDMIEKYKYRKYPELDVIKNSME